jgi:hypothetical protein
MRLICCGAGVLDTIRCTHYSLYSPYDIFILYSYYYASLYYTGGAGVLGASEGSERVLRGG